MILWLVLCSFLSGAVIFFDVPQGYIFDLIFKTFTWTNS